MSERAVVLTKLEKKEAEIQLLEDKLRAARVYAQALRDVISAMGRDIPEASSDSALRSGSSVALAREVILNAGRAVHITELLEGLGKGVTREARASLASSLAAYVRRGEIFTRPAPNTFGLVELGNFDNPEPAQAEPPPGFGALPSARSDDDEPKW